MSKGTEKLSAILGQLKKLPPKRKVYWLQKLDSLRKVARANAIAKSRELGAEPHIIQMPVTTIVGEIGSKSWIQDVSGWLDSAYQSASDFSDETSLAIANTVDKLYTTVTDEVVKVPGMIGDAAGKLIAPITSSGYMPYIIGAGLSLGVVYYLTQIAPIRR